MDELAAIRRERAVNALLPLFFLSGATALVYQTIWTRELHLLFGTSTFAIATVLSTFMAGLALGGFAMARVADRATRPLAIYGGLEVGIGLYALAFPAMVRWVTPLYLEVWRTFEPGPVAYGAVQYVLVGATLILPTAAMGGTLPILARFATERLGAAGDRVGTLYAVNTFGAVVGTGLCGFVLLPWLGLHATTVWAAAANLVLGLGAVALDLYARADGAVVEDDLRADGVVGVHPELRSVAIAMLLAGFASLVYEVAWTRLMGLMLGASVYAFSTMLLAFLIGIAIGGKFGGWGADRLIRARGTAGVLRALAMVEVGVATTSYLLMYLYQELPFWYVWLFDWAGAAQEPLAIWVVSTMMSALVMTPPALLMGAAFPLAVRAVVGRDDALGGPVGDVYAANTLGGVVGAALAGFVLLPNLDVQGTLFVAACANLLAAALLLLRSEGGRAGAARLAPVGVLGLGLLFVAQEPPWDPLLMTAGMYQYVSHFDDHTRQGIADYSVGKYELLYYEEGLSTVVTVAKNRTSNNIWLANNGKVDASTTTDMPTQVLCALLPMQFTPEREEVLVIGLASGITAGAVTVLDDVERLDIVELEPAIEPAARFFDDQNHHVLDDPRTNLILNDGRNHLTLTPPATYDVIVSEPSNPWITGVSNLFTVEFFELGKSRLKPGGVWSQWVQMYGMDSYDLRSLLRTFATVYPHVLVYATIEEADLVLVGSDRPLNPTLENAERLMGGAKAGAEMRLVDITSPYELVAIFQMDRDRVLEVTEGVPVNTDDNMRIEYAAPKNLHRDTQQENFNFLLESAIVPLEAMGGDADRLAELARTYQARDDVVRSVQTMAHAVARLDEADPRRDPYLDEAEEWQRELMEELQQSRED